LYEVLINYEKDKMEIAIEWDGISGVIKILLLIAVIFFVGYKFGRKTK